MTSLKFCTYVLMLTLAMTYLLNADKLKYTTQTKPNIGETKLSYILDFYPVQTQLSFSMHVSIIFRDDKNEREHINKWYLIPTRNVCKGKTLTFRIVVLMEIIRKQLGTDIVIATIRIKVIDHSPSTPKSYISDFVNINDGAVETPPLGAAKQVTSPKRDQYTATKRRSPPQRVVSDPPLRPQRLQMPQRPQIPQRVTIKAGLERRRPKYSSHGSHAVPRLNLTNDSNIYSVDDIEREWRSKVNISQIDTHNTTLIPTRAHNIRDIYTTRFTHTQQPTLSKIETQNESSQFSFGASDIPTIPTNTPTKTPTNTPTNTPTKTPTNTPTKTPTNTPTKTPTNTPTIEPTTEPTLSPTIDPTESTLTPTISPTNVPTYNPTQSPTVTESTNKENMISERSENPLLRELTSPENMNNETASSANKQNETTTRNDNPLLRERSPEHVHIENIIGLETPANVNNNNDTYIYSIKHSSRHNKSHTVNKTTSTQYPIPIFMTHPICVLSFAVFVILVVCILMVYAFRDNICALLYSRSRKQRLARQIAMQVNDDDDDAFVTNTYNAFIHTSIRHEDRQIKQDWIRGTL